MLRTVLLASALMLGACVALAQNAPTEMPAGTYKSDENHTSLTWKVSHMGLSYYTARFTHVNATLTFDPKDPAKSSLVVHIDPLSVRTDFPHPDKKDFDSEIAKGEGWLNAGKFPDITFVSASIEKTGDATGKVRGNLTFLGVSKPVTLDVTMNGAYAKMPMMDIPALGFSATATLKRSDWGMNNYVPMIGDEVAIVIEIEFHKDK